MDSPLSGARWAAPLFCALSARLVPAGRAGFSGRARGDLWGILPHPRRPAAQAPDSPHISDRHAGPAGGIRWTLASPQFSPGAVARASRARQIGAHVGPSDADVLYSTSRSEGRVRPEMTRPWRSQ